VRAATASDYADYLNRSGGSAHLSGGVWWVRRAPFYFKPLVEARAFPRGTSRPSILKGGIAYCHQVCKQEEATRVVEFMVLSGSRLREFSLGNLRADKRNQVRKGLRSCTVSQFGSFDEHVEDLRRINISQAERLARGHNHGRPSTYYQGEARSWRRAMARLFGAPGHSWWGAWVEGRLAAYALTTAIEDVLIVSAAKSDAAYHSANANDAIYFTLLSAASANGGFSVVINGGPLRPSLDRFKEGFGFSRIASHYFVRDFGISTLVRGGRQMLRRAREGAACPMPRTRDSEKLGRGDESSGQAA
jgi:hypothetical protein